MKYIWEEKDINCGRIVCKNVKFEPTDGWQAWRTFKIGYVGGSSTYDETGGGVVLISMTDGMVGTRRSKQDMANYLSNEGMISMPYENFIKLMDVFQKGNYES